MIALATVGVALLLWIAFGLLMAHERRSLVNALLLGLALFATILSLWVLAGSLPAGRTILIIVGIVLMVASLALPFAMITNGIIMRSREGHNLANSLALLAGATLLAVAALPIIFAALGVPLVVFWLSIGLLSIVFYLGALFISYLAYGWLYGRLGPSRPADGIVILGSGLINGHVPPLLASRLDTAIDVYQNLQHQGSPTILIPSGGQGSDEPVAEGTAMTHYLLAHDIPSEDILTEDLARTTGQNIINSRELLAQHGHNNRLAIVTNDYHTLRAAVLSRALRADAQIIGAPTAAYFLPSALLREFAALITATRWWHITLALTILILATSIGLTA